MPRKNSRRNPWGNCSYSDLIEQVGPTLRSPQWHGHAAAGDTVLPRQEADPQPDLRLADLQRGVLHGAAGQRGLQRLEELHPAQPLPAPEVPQAAARGRGQVLLVEPQPGAAVSRRAQAEAPRHLRRVQVQRGQYYGG